jgi:hypothetical protein
MQVEKSVNDDLTIVYDFIDDLIIGNSKWPRASRAITCVEFLDKLLECDRIWVMQNARLLGTKPASARSACLEAIERNEPETFQRVLKVLYGAYYTAPAVIARVQELASSSPREPSETFDTTFLSNVLRTQAGKRRL